jgi:hypothetical protein
MIGGDRRLSAVHSSILDKPFGPHRFTVSSQDWRACDSVRPLYGVASVLNVRPSTNLPRTPGSSYVEMTQLRTVPRPNNSSRLCRQIDMQSHANRLFFERKAKELNGLSQSVNETTTRYDTKSAMRRSHPHPINIKVFLSSQRSLATQSQLSEAL